MPLGRQVHLDAEEREALEQLRDRSPKPYLRERAAALLQIADGEYPAAVARSGLLRPREPDTIYAWLDRFEQEGIDGLRIRPGCGRKPVFSP
jgi:hypothetical protein